MVWSFFSGPETPLPRAKQLAGQVAKNLSGHHSVSLPRQPEPCGKMCYVPTAGWGDWGRIQRNSPGDQQRNFPSVILMSNVLGQGPRIPVPSTRTAKPDARHADCNKGRLPSSRSYFSLHFFFRRGEKVNKIKLRHSSSYCLTGQK